MYKANTVVAWVYSSTKWPWHSDQLTKPITAVGYLL